MSVSQKHAQAIAHYEAGRFVEAIRLLEVLLIESPTSELWNDWATAQLANGDAAKANDGFAQALAIDPGNHAAAINYGVLLCTTGRTRKGKPLLEGLLAVVGDAERAQLTAFLANVPAEARSKSDTSTSPLNVLVIHEILPHADRHGADVQWMQVLAELRAQGHQMTHVARSGVNRDRYAPEVERLGIRVLAPDAERMRYAG
jgi:tetratricopeptide (TPR) repeat protein